MIDSLWTEIRKINIFGRDYQFEKDYSNRSNSIISFILTCIIFIGTVIVGFIFGQEIYKRKNPKLTSSMINIKEEETEINFLEFPIIFKFYNNRGGPLQYDEEISKLFNISLVEFEIKSNSFLGSKYSHLSICDLNKYKNLTKYNEIERLSNLAGSSYCIDPKKLIMNKKASFNSKNLIIQISKCQINCLADLDLVSEGVFIEFNYIEDYINPYDYANPINYNNRKEIFKLSNKISREITVSFRKNQLNTNKAWIFDDYINNTFISFDSFFSEYYFDSSSLIRIYIDSKPFVKNEFREYLKIQDLFASIGGFFNAIYIIFTFLFSHYIKFTYYQYVYIRIISKEEQDKIESGLGKDISTNHLKNNLKNKEINNDCFKNKSYNTNTKSLSNFNLKKVFENSQNINQYNDHQSKILKNILFDQNQLEQVEVQNNEENNRENCEYKESLPNLLEIDKNIIIKQKQEELYTEYYVVYLFQKIICCRNYNKKMFNLCNNLLSFDLFLERSHKYNETIIK